MEHKYQPKDKRQLYDDLSYALDDYAEMVDRHGEMSKDAAQCEAHIRWLCKGAIDAGMAPEFYEKKVQVNGKTRSLKWRFGDCCYWDELCWNLSKEFDAHE